MTPWKFEMNPFKVGLGIAVVVASWASDAVAGVLPKDPCTLLKPAEIQALDSNATVGSGVLNGGMAPLGVGCTYTWGPRTPEWGESAVTITVIDASKAWPGTDAGALREGLLAKVRAEGPNASEVPGVGDAAVFTFEARSSNATVEAYFKTKGVHLSVTFHAGDSLAKRDKIIALLKDAAARL
jgi:hypothetical protein